MNLNKKIVDALRVVIKEMLKKKKVCIMMNSKIMNSKHYIIKGITKVCQEVKTDANVIIIVYKNVEGLFREPCVN